MSKSDLQAQPIYHRKRDSTEAHLTIVFAKLASRWIEVETGAGRSGNSSAPPAVGAPFRSRLAPAPSPSPTSSRRQGHQPPGWFVRVMDPDPRCGFPPSPSDGLRPDASSAQAANGGLGLEAMLLELGP
jgi:hypothetical protein